MGEWVSGVFGCFNNIGLCVITFCAPCYTFGKNAAALGEDCLMCGLLMCFCPYVAYGAQMVMRTKLRERRGIDGSLMMDLFWTALCPCCTIIQEAVEIEAMGGGGEALQMARQ